MSTTSSPTSSAPSRAPRPNAAAAAWLAVAGLEIVLVLIASVAATDADTREAFYEYGTAIGNVFFYLVIIALTVAIARLTGNTRDALGLHRFAGRWVFIALAVVAGVAVLTYVISVLFDLNPSEEQGILPETWRPERAGAIAANAFVATIAAPVAEELFYRGVGVSALSIFGSVAAVVMTGVAFGLVHGLLTALLPLTLFGIGLSWVRLRSSSVFPGMIAHALYNGFVLTVGLVCLADPECRSTLSCVT